jgi:hypothetical protein
MSVFLQIALGLETHLAAAAAADDDDAVIIIIIIIKLFEICFPLPRAS